LCAVCGGASGRDVSIAAVFGRSAEIDAAGQVVGATEAIQRNHRAKGNNRDSIPFFI